MRLRGLLVGGTLALATACQPPPPAPEGLDDATSYLVREFYASDAVFEAGLLGYMNWFVEEGFELAGERADVENTDAFTVGDLAEGDVAHLPLEHGRPVEDSAGVVSLAEMDCDITQTEGLILRPDQENVFSGDWTSYSRSYETSREDWQEATASGDYDSVVEALEPYGAEPLDFGPWSRTFIQTSNVVDPEPEWGGLADLDAYDLFLDFRHGVFDLGEEEPRQVFAVLSWQTESLANPNAEGWLHQTYGLEIDIERDGGRTLRMMAVWTELEGAGLESDTALVLNLSVNKALESSERLSGICSGDIDIPTE